MCLSLCTFLTDSRNLPHFASMLLSSPCFSIISFTKSQKIFTVAFRWHVIKTCLQSFWSISCCYLGRCTFIKLLVCAIQIQSCCHFLKYVSSHIFDKHSHSVVISKSCLTAYPHFLSQLSWTVLIKLCASCINTPLVRRL